MISYEEARAKILAQIVSMPTTSLPLKRLLGHVTAEPVIARIDSPPFDNSAVDGYGVRLDDVSQATELSPVSLALKETVRAGDVAVDNLAAGTAMKILTGAWVAPSVEAVVMREYCTEKDGLVLVGTRAESGANIRRRGTEFEQGKAVLPERQLLSPPVVALIASLGYKDFSVYRKPKVAVVTTGDELTKPGRTLMAGKIYDSNSYAIDSAVRCDGLEDVLILHAREQLAATKSALLRALRFADVVISTGGVSVGEFDFVKIALEELGVKTQLWRISIKPGKPVYFGIFDDIASGRRKYVFGLPGNPVSALVTYHLFVKPAIKKLRGLGDFAEELWLPARMTKPLSKKPGRLEFPRGRVSSDGSTVVVEPATAQDSHMLSGLAGANALIYFPLDAGELPAGTIVKTQLLSWNS